MKACTNIKQQEYIMRYNLQWFAQDGEGGEKTEPATQKKLNDARKDGKVAKSKELTDAVSLITLFLVLKIFISMVGGNLLTIFSIVYTRMSEFTHSNQLGFTSYSIRTFINQMILKWMVIVLPFFAFGLGIAFLITLYQVGWKVSTKPMHPNISKFNPINGMKRIFSKESLFNLVMAFFKITLIGAIAYFSIRDKSDELFILYEISLQQAIGLIGEIIIDTGLRISILYLLVGVVDYVYHKWKFSEDMKMTKQEVKDEYKNTEGDPQIKSRQRSKMREVSRQRMMQDVPKADVVITNPTHFAVALKYDAETGKAPVLLAKGEDYLALKIKEIARENHVEIVENKPLARMIYHNVDVGAEIPPELYQSVAEVLAMVYRMNGKI